jgi:hypothetical protein
MVQMTPKSRTSALGSQFNAFLFASIDEDSSEAPLSVVSALARLDLDPWEEAADLTALPRDTAAQRLVSLLTKLPGGQLSRSDHQTIAARLIALLPHAASPDLASAQPSAQGGGSTHVDPAKVVIFYLAGWAIAMVISGFTGHPTTTPANTASATAASTPTAPTLKVQR